MTTEQIMMKLAQIRGTSNERHDARENSSSKDISEYPKSGESAIKLVELPTTIEEQSTGYAGETGDWSKELKNIAILWGGILSERGIVINNTIEMSKKDYLKHIKGKNRDQILTDPLLYVMFRAEEQGEANFFNWLDRFPKAKDENKQ